MSKNTKLPLPSHIHALGVPYQVELVDVIDEVTDDMEPTWGDTTNISRRIRVAAFLDTRRRWSTLWHETLHATLYTIGAQLSDDVEEMIVQSIEHATEQFMREHGASYLKALDTEKD